MHESYELGGESDRLATSAQGRLEFERSQEILLRALLPVPAVIADIGGIGGVAAVACSPGSRSSAARTGRGAAHGELPEI